MTKVCLIKFLLLLFFSISALAQKKIKYKDIYGLLSTKQYDLAEPFLKQYLSSEDDNSNAFLYMGLIYEEKAAANDVLKETAVLLNRIDSAIYYFEKASASIDEREIRKNKEYYQAYNRRDLRTGEFGVKLSDIQFDMQKRKEALSERRERIRMVKHYFTLADSLYRKCTVLFDALRSTYPTTQSLYLQAGDSTLSMLDALSVRFDSTVRFVGNYQSSLETLGETGYHQTFELHDISEFEKDGGGNADFLASVVPLWDYKSFTRGVRQVVTNEIRPLRSQLVSFDTEINKLKDILRRDSVSVAGELDDLQRRLPYKALDKYDRAPLPLSVLELKIAELRYQSLLVETRLHADSMDVHYQLNRALAEQRGLSRLDSLAGVILSSDLEAALANYPHFISTTYNNMIVLRTYVKGIKEYAARKAALLAERLDNCRDAVRWIAFEGERIPLFMNDSLFRYRPLVTEDEQYTAGLDCSDSISVSGYFYTITPSREPDIHVKFPVDEKHFNKAAISSLRSLATDADELIYFVLICSSEQEEEKFPATIAKIYRSDGLSWSKNYALDFVPESIGYNTGSGELIVEDGNNSFVLDKNGKPR